jgi:hypothetical protein
MDYYYSYDSAWLFWLVAFVVSTTTAVCICAALVQPAYRTVR